MYECTWIDTEYDIEVGTYDMDLPTIGQTIDGFTITSMTIDNDADTAVLYGTWE